MEQHKWGGGWEACTFGGRWGRTAEHTARGRASLWRTAGGLAAGSDLDGISERTLRAQPDLVTCSLDSGHRGSSGNEKGPLESLSESIELDTWVEFRLEIQLDVVSKVNFQKYPISMGRFDVLFIGIEFSQIRQSFLLPFWCYASFKNYNFKIFYLKNAADLFVARKLL